MRRSRMPVPVVIRKSSAKPFRINPHSSSSILVRCQPDINQLPVVLCRICFAFLYPVVSLSLLNASSISTRLALSRTRTYPLARHAFHICYDSIPLHKPQISFLSSILHKISDKSFISLPFISAHSCRQLRIPSCASS